MSTKKRFLIFLLLMMLAVAIGYYFYNKGAVNFKNSGALNITAVELYNIYEDTLTPQKKITGKVLKVAGIISKIEMNQQNETILFLKTNTAGAFINCSMQQTNITLKVNDSTHIKGLCSGIGQGDTDLGIKADVYLTSCWITE